MFCDVPKYGLEPRRLVNASSPLIYAIDGLLIDCFKVLCILLIDSANADVSDDGDGCLFKLVPAIIVSLSLNLNVPSGASNVRLP